MGQGRSRWGPAPGQPYFRTTEAPLCPLVSRPLSHLLYILASSGSLSGMPVASVRAGRSLVRYLDFHKSFLPLESCQGDLLPLSVLS